MDALGSFQDLLENETNLLFEAAREDFLGQNQDDAFINIKTPRHSMSREKEVTSIDSEVFRSPFTEEPIIVSNILGVLNKEVRFKF